MWAITMQSRHEMGDEERRGREGYYIMELRQGKSTYMYGTWVSEAGCCYVAAC